MGLDGLRELPYYKQQQAHNTFTLNTTQAFPNNPPEREPDMAALRVDTPKSLKASSTSLSRPKGSRRILAMDSDMRMMASNCLWGRNLPYRVMKGERMVTMTE